MRNIKKFDQFNEGLFDFMNRGKRGKDILDMIEELTPEDITKEDNSPIEISYKFDDMEVTKFLNENRYYVLENEKEVNLSQEVSKSIYERLEEIKG
jgi:uncharacterized protein YacL